MDVLSKRRGKVLQLDRGGVIGCLMRNLGGECLVICGLLIAEFVIHTYQRHADHVHRKAWISDDSKTTRNGEIMKISI